MKTIKAMIVVMALTISVGAFADTYTFIATNTAAQSPWVSVTSPILWGAGANWLGGSAPATSADIVLPDLPSDGTAQIGSQRIMTWKYANGTEGVNGVNPTIGAITGGRRYVITHGSRPNNEGSFANPRRFTIENPNNFDGI